MTCEIITVGDELLIGQIINTNQAYIAERMNTIGIDVVRMTTVGDTMPEILAAFGDAWRRHQVVIVTGGLGPTHDDITKKAVCTFFDTDLVSNEEVRRHIETLMKQRNRDWSAAAEEQTMVPRKATVVPNPVGTAPGMLFREDRRCFLALPGVPYEMKEMVDRTIVPFLAKTVDGTTIRHVTLRTTGISESALAQQLGDLDEILRGSSLAFLPAPTGVRLRITVHDRNDASAEGRVRDIEQRIRAKVQKYIYGTDNEELEQVLGRILTEKKLTLAVAESCTGGLIAHRLTNVSGSSTYFERGVVTYSNESKISLLGVSPELIENHGAVSREVAEQMAAGIRTRAGTDIGLSTTGIAGPTGGTDEKPVGLVWIGYSDRMSTLALKFHFGTYRSVVKELAATAGLELVRKKVLKIDS